MEFNLVAAKGQSTDYQTGIENQSPLKWKTKASHQGFLLGHEYDTNMELRTLFTFHRSSVKKTAKLLGGGWGAGVVTLGVVYWPECSTDPGGLICAHTGTLCCFMCWYGGVKINCLYAWHTCTQIWWSLINSSFWGKKKFWAWDVGRRDDGVHLQKASADLT